MKNKDTIINIESTLVVMEVPRANWLLKIYYFMFKIIIIIIDWFKLY